MVLVLQSGRCYEAEICTILLPLRYSFTRYPFFYRCQIFQFLVYITVHILLQRIWWLGKFDRVAVESSEGDGGDVRAEVEEERVQSCTQPHGGEDAKTKPVAAPQYLHLKP